MTRRSRSGSRLILALVIFAITTTGWPAITTTTAQTPVAEPLGHIDASSTVSLDFPTGMTIAGELQWDPALEGTEIVLLFAIANDPTEQLTFVNEALEPGAHRLSASATLDLQSRFVPSGVPVTYRWRLERDQEVVAESPPESTLWYDDRWEWSEVASSQVRVHTYDHSGDFANEILTSAQSTVSALEERYALDESAPLDIWVYPSLDDFRGAQQPNSRESVAGASYPGYELIVAVVDEGDTSEVGRVIPHEISHQVLHQATDNPFTYPPLWFDEGLATHFQIGGTDGYQEMVARALDNGALYDLTSLEVSFPYGPAEATLAYAVSWSAIAYLEETYGDESISALIEAFAAGTSHDAAVRNALGIEAAQLNDDWQAWVQSTGD